MAENGQNGQNGHEPSSSDPLVVVSCDTHIGPLIKQQLREYCPKKYLEDFDAFVAYVEGTGTVRVAQEAAERDNSVTDAGRAALAFGPMRTTGHHDVYARIRDLDADGTAAEVIFHGSQNGEPIPFNVSDPSIGGMTMSRTYDVDAELAGVGRHIYNQWLADFCSVEPERHVGLAHLPMWDVDAAVEELKWAREAGLRGVNFPAEAGPDLTSRSRWAGRHAYNDPIWEPFWSAVEDLDMALCTHGGAGDVTMDLPGGHTIWIHEAQELARRAIHRMVFGGVFERHPGLRMVLTEQPGMWWVDKMRDMDSLQLTVAAWDGGMTKKPSEYCKQSVFLGASFQSRIEAEEALANDYMSQIIWGTDYPHTEGTWMWPEDPEAEPMSHKCLRFAYAGFPDQVIRDAVGLTGVRVYGLDGDALAKVAARINAPTIDAINRPLEEIPAVHGMWAFREVGAFG